LQSLQKAIPDDLGHIDRPAYRFTSCLQGDLIGALVELRYHRQHVFITGLAPIKTTFSAVFASAIFCFTSYSR